MAAYCNAADVRAMLKDDLINSLLGDQYIRDEAEREQRLLPLIEAAAGTVSIGADSESPSAASATGFQMSGPQRIFSRDRMRGM